MRKNYYIFAGFNIIYVLVTFYDSKNNEIDYYIV